MLFQDWTFLSPPDPSVLMVLESASGPRHCACNTKLNFSLFLTVSFGKGLMFLNLLKIVKWGYLWFLLCSVVLNALWGNAMPSMKPVFWEFSIIYLWFRALSVSPQMARWASPLTAVRCKNISLKQDASSLLLYPMGKGWAEISSNKISALRGQRKARTVNQPYCTLNRDGASACQSRFLTYFFMSHLECGRQMQQLDAFFFSSIVSHVDPIADWWQAQLPFTCDSGCSWHLFGDTRAKWHPCFPLTHIT